MPTVHRPAAAVALVTASIALVGCSALGGAGGASTPTPTGTPEVDVLSLAVGDCLDADSRLVTPTVPVVDCALNHESEAYALLAIPASAFQGEEAITTSAETFCAEAFTDFVGIRYDDSSLDYSYYFPTAGSWAEGDRRILCLVLDPGQRVSGTLEGAAR